MVTRLCVPIIRAAHNPLVVESNAADKLLVTLQNTQTSSALDVPQPTNTQHRHTHVRFDVETKNISSTQNVSGQNCTAVCYLHVM